MSQASLQGRASLEGGSLDEISRLLGIPVLPVTGGIGAEGEFGMKSFAPESLEVRGSVTLAGKLRQGTREAVSGSGRFRLGGSSLVVEASQVKTASASAEFQGRADLAGERDVDGEQGPWGIGDGSTKHTG